MKNDDDPDILSSALLIFYKYDITGSIYEFISTDILKLTGYTRAEISKISFESLISEKIEIRNIQYQLKNNLFSEISAEYLIKTKNGKPKLVTEQSYVEHDEEGNKKSIFGVLHEVSPRFLNKSENETTVSGIPGMPTYEDFLVFTVDKTRKISFINKKALSYINYKCDKVAGNLWHECFNYATGDILVRLNDDLFDKKENLPRLFELNLNIPGIGEKFIRFNYFRVVKSGEIDSVVFFGEDITESRKSAAADKLIEKLTSLNSSKDKLISQISHDLRSPFNSLLGFSEILTTEFDTLTKYEIQEYLQAIYEASKNLFGMTNNLLHFSRFQMGRMEYKPENLKLLKIINKCLSLIKGNAIKKQINISMDVSGDIEVFADEDMLISIIQNLISNAVKFTQKNGAVRISAEPEGTSSVEISVHDTGIGMNKESLDRIFAEKFYSTPGTEKEFGTGLGLILVKEFIEKHNGKLSIESKPGEGSAFHFNLPAARQ